MIRGQRRVAIAAASSLSILAIGAAALTSDEAAWTEGGADRRAALDPMQGKAPPPLMVENWTNSPELSLDKLKGKVVLLDFWATWCGPCIASIPHTNELMEKHGKDGLVIIGVCHPRGGEKMAQTATSKGIKYPIGLDTNGETIKAFQVDSYPDYYLIDRAGNLRVADCKNGSIDEVIAKLLAEPAAAPAAAE